MAKLANSEGHGNHRKAGRGSAGRARRHSAQQLDPRARWLLLGDAALVSNGRRKRASTSWVQFRELQKSVHDNGVDFLHTDLDVALTMAQIAAEADRSSERRKRNVRNARKAYDTIVKLHEKVHASAAERHCLRRKLSHLRLCLEDLGERFDRLAIVA